MEFAPSSSPSSSSTPLSSPPPSPSLSAKISALDPKFLPQKVDPKILRFQKEHREFLWLKTDQIHNDRKREILKRYPEITSLMRPEPLTFPLVIFVVTLQLSLAVLLSSYSPFSLTFILTAYIIGGTANQNLFLAIHEITHNLVFRDWRKNRLLAMLANLPIGIPYAMMFKTYHMEHHRYLGLTSVDTDIPTRLEVDLLSSISGKIFFLTFQILFYALRPGFVHSIPFTRWTALNIVVQVLADVLLVKAVGWGGLIYLLMSSFFAGSIHPMASHFIAEHYLFSGYTMETYSYYGPLNILAYNVGYHNEHHDFPSIPWSRLPKVREIAREFYDVLPEHKSWVGVLWRFLVEEETGLWARAKRERMSDGGLKGMEEKVKEIQGEWKGSEESWEMDL